jgi:hypothetical protein
MARMVEIRLITALEKAIIGELEKEDRYSLYVVIPITIGVLKFPYPKNMLSSWHTWEASTEPGG